MKKSILLLAMLILVGAGVNATAQDQPKPKKDTVNMDTYAKPEKYYDIEDDKGTESGKSGSSGIVIGVIAGVVVIAGIAGYLMTRKKK